MIEVALAVSVLAAVLMIGAIISIGNERQRRAIEILRMDLRQWALGDLEIKREKAARELNIIDPMRWMDDVARRAIGLSPQLIDVAKVLDIPDAIVVSSERRGYLVFSPVHPSQMPAVIKVLKAQSNGAIPSGILELTKRRTRARAFELSALNAGVFFDIEADKVWRMVAERPLDSNQVWLYDIPGQHGDKKV